MTKFERGGAVKENLVEAIQRSLERAGVILVDVGDGGPGVRLRSDQNTLKNA